MEERYLTCVVRIIDVAFGLEACDLEGKEQRGV